MTKCQLEGVLPLTYVYLSCKASTGDMLPVLPFFVLYMISCTVNSQDTINYALAFLKSQRHIIGLNVFCKMSPNLAKILLEDENLIMTVRFNKRPVSMEDSVIYCADDNKPDNFMKLLHSKPKLAVGVAWFVVGTGMSLNMLHETVKTNIDKRLYFLNSDNRDLKEIYYSNNEKISKILGFIENENQTRLVWSNPREFESRRANLRGLNVKIHGALAISPLSYYDLAVPKSVHWEKDRKGAVIADVSQEKHLGTLAEVVEIIKEDLNFSTTNFVRKDQQFGWPIIKNGTFVGMTGMFGDLLTGDVDTIVAPVEFIVERIGTMRFSHPVGTFTNALLVGAEAGDEDKEFLVYLQPFRTNLWIVLIFNILIAALGIELIQHIYFRQIKFNVLLIMMKITRRFWTIFQSYLGAPSRSKFWSYLPSAGMLFIITLLMGNLVFMSYKAALTSELSLRRKTLPFDSPEGLYHSSYSMIYVWVKMERLLNRYKSYPDLNMIRKTFHKQDNSETLVRPFTRALQQLTEPYSRKTLYNYAEKYHFFSDYKCSVIIAWKRSFPILLSLPFRKDWPYGDLINFAILKSINHGFLKKFQEDYYGGKFVTCPSNFKGAALGLYKILGTFVVLVIGICISITMFIVEVVYYWCTVNRTIFWKSPTKFKEEPSNGKFEVAFREISSIYGPVAIHQGTVFDYELRSLLNEFKFVQ